MKTTSRVHRPGGRRYTTFAIRRRLTVMLRAIAFLLASLSVSAQTFDVVSIKPTPGQPRNSGFRRASPGNLNATNVTVKMLIEFAYDVRDDQISGGPGWLDSDRYEVVAKPPEASAAENSKLLKVRTQNLLADRFHVALRRETREMPVLALLVAKNGPKGLKPAAAGGEDLVTNGRHLDCKQISVAMFAKMFLAPQTRRSVIDKTGIEGRFDFTLDWSPDDAPPSTSGEAEPAERQFPPLLLALQEQLGLKLEQQKGPVEVLVIERAEKPSEN